MSDNHSPAESGVSLVGSETLLEILFPNERDRPKLRWLASMRERKIIPFVKLGGRLVRYDVIAVRAAIDKAFTVDSIDIR